MSFTVSHASAILPFCYRKVINDKGGTASVCIYGIQADLVGDDNLNNTLEPSKKEQSDHGLVRLTAALPSQSFNNTALKL